MGSITSKRWPIIEDMLQSEGIARQHLNSFSEFLSSGIQSVIDEAESIEIEDPTNPFTIKLGKISIEKPRILEVDGSVARISPAEARMRSMTYAAPLMVETSIIHDGQQSKPKLTHIGDIPIMIKSDACILYKETTQKLIELGEDSTDPGGYFIINGSERIIMGAEDLSFGKIMVDKEVIGEHTYHKAKIYSAIIGYRSKLELVTKGDGPVQVSVPGSPVDIPLIVLQKALGLESDKEVADSISMVDDILDGMDSSFASASPIPIASTEDAIEYIGKRIAPGMVSEFQIKRANILLDWGMLPHIGKDPENRREKAYLLGEAANKLLELKLEWILPDDRDHYGNKVMKFGGQLLADLFRTCFRNLVKDIKYQLERSGQQYGVLSVDSAIRPGIITDKLQNAIATGNWGRGKVGVTQSLDRSNYLSTITHLRRMLSALSRTQPNYKARDVHPTHFGRICPSETPEGSNCGLVKNLALSGIVALYASPKDVTEKLYNFGVIHFFDAKPDLRRDGTHVFVDGKLLGYYHDGQKLAEMVRQLRRTSKIHPHIGVALVKNENKGSTKRLYVSCNAGRIIRPLIIIKDGKPLLTDEMIQSLKDKKISWFDFLKMGVIELLDSDEEENCFMTLDENKIGKHTHLEIFPSAILSAAASIIPYPESNQSPRVTYFSAMSKQGVGFSTPMKNTSPYVRQHVMLYPQIPIVKTKAMKPLGIEDRPAGQNVCIAVLPFDGYNIEDAIVFNKSSVQRGLGRSFFYRIYRGNEVQYPGGAHDNFEVPSPDDNISGYKGSHAYRLLDESDGVVAPGAEVKPGDTLIGRTSPPRFMDEFSEFSAEFPHKRDTSINMRPTESGVVDDVILTQSGDGSKMYKVRTRNMRIPEIGDKFASRHGQKGVCGILANAEDLPYTELGMSPDVMINPHAFPSRMTVGQLIESVCGKAAALRGESFDGSAFVGDRVDVAKSVLEANGFKHTGKEIMYDGRSGKKFEVEVFIGIVYYLKLQHMVADKMQARARGSVHIMTRQPTAGKAKGGGLRFGEMERDCIIAYGASMILKDRLLDESDRSEVLVCERCGLMAYHDLKLRRYLCRVCGRRSRVAKVSIAYAFKLLLQEMQGLNIAPRLLLRDYLSPKSSLK